MKEGEAEGEGSGSLGRYFWILVFSWTVALVGLLLWGIHRNRAETRVLASQVAGVHFEKERAFRLWAASHGGIYVPVDARTPPNPLLEHVPDRDVRTPSGRLLTLVPGFHMVRQLREEFPELYGVKGATTSLKPLRAENSPDEWQKRALEAFERGEQEVREFTEISGETYLRLMRPHPGEKGCLKCHAKTGFKEGDILGGIEVAMPLKPFQHQEHQQLKALVFSYSAVFLLGLVGLVIGRRKLERGEAERTAARESLRESEERYRELVEISDDVVYRTDAGGVFAFVNHAASRITGYSEEELIGLRYTDLIPPEYREETEKFYGRQFVKRIPTTHYEFPFRTKNGDLMWMGQNVHLLIKDDEVVGFQSIARDITERRRSEKSLLESEGRYRSLVEDSFEGIFIQEGTKIVYANSRLYEMLGYEEGELEGEEHWLVYDPAYYDLTRERAQARMRGEDVPPRYEVKLRRKDGSSFDGEITARAVSLRGKVGIQVWVRDISETKKHEQALVRAKEEWESTFDAISDFILILDTQHRIVRANRAMVEALGMGEEDPGGKHCYELVHGTEQPPWFCPHVQLLADGHEHSVEVVEPRINGLLEVRVSPLLDTQGVVVGSVHVARDISERKRAAEVLKESEERYRSTMDAVGVGIYLIQDLVFRYVNPEMAHLHGYEPEEITDRLSPVDLVAPEQREAVRENLTRRAHGEPGRLYEIKCLRKDGSVFDCSVWGKGITYQGRPASVGTLFDITDRRRAEGAVRESEERYRSLYDMMLLMCNNVPDLIWAKDLDKRYIFANRAICDRLLNATSQDEPVGNNDMFFAQREREAHPDNPNWHTFGEICADSDAVVMTTGMPQRFDEFGNVKGEFLCLDVYKAPLRNEQGEMVGTVGCGRDVTRERKMEDSLRKSEERYRDLFQHASDLIYTHDLEGNYTSVNDAGRNLLGYSHQEFMNLNFRDIVDPDYLSVTEESFRKKVFEGHEVTGPHEVAVRSKDGTRLWLEVTSRIVEKEGSLTGVHGIARDITYKKALEAEVHEAQMKYQSVVESFDGLIYICSQNYEVEFANQRLVQRTGYDPVGKKCFEAFHNREEICPWCVHERVFRGETVSGKFHDKRDNRVYNLILSPISHPDGTLSSMALIQDITEQKKAEEEQETLREQLFQSQKMEAVGTLAGGIAHDFNNLLQAISGYSELLLMNPKLEEKTLLGLNRIFQAARNGAALVKGLLALSGRTEPQRKPMNVNHQVDEVVNLLSRTIPKVIELEAYLDHALPLVNGDPVQVHQVLMNLGINARDAMPDGGRLVFETSKVQLDETYCKTHGEVEPGTYVLLSVSDTGTGMDQETAARIFEPFFTTKPVGAGTGLGLSIVYGIVKQHGGAIRCYSEPGRGTTFKVYFPIIEETVELSEEVSRDPLPPGGTETILLVDDDQVVRELAESMLVEMGYTVLTASNGKDAVERYRIEREKISLVILDLVMPEMDGQRCLREILKMDPSARVLIASGHAENGIVKETIERGARGFVHKPYDVRQLLQKVRDVLDHE